MTSASSDKKGCISFTFDLRAVVAAIIALIAGVWFGTVGSKQLGEQPIPTVQPTFTVEIGKVLAPKLATDTPYPPNPTYTPYPIHTPYPPNPTYTPYPPNPTYTPYPTFTPYLVVATRGPVIITPTLSAEEQNPPPGSIIPAGEAYTKGGITIRLLKKMQYGDDNLSFTFEIENGSKEQYLIRWKNSAIHLRDDVGKQYLQYGEEEEKIYDKVKAFTLDPGKSTQLRSSAEGYWYRYPAVDRFGAFKGPLSYDAKYLLITIDQIVGMSNLNWRYDLP
ncbi:MAG: hypothetical protein ACE5MB_06240 [Anaerolineae bacterium]